MESNKLAILETHLPLKNYPKDGEKLNSDILLGLMPFISGLLSLTDEVSAKRLKIALPAVKEHCWSMGLAEIKKMFEMYVDNKLSIEPIPNYFDRILFGKIVAAYKQQKPIKIRAIKEPEMTQEQKDANVLMGVINCFDNFIQERYIPSGYVWVYKHLIDDLKVHSFTPDEKKKQMVIAKEVLIKEAKDGDRNEYTQFMFDLENNLQDDAIKVQAKKMLLEKWFAKLESQKKHIKELI